MTPIPTESPTPPSPLRILPWVLVLALLVTTTWLVVRNLALQAANTGLETERRLADIAYRTAQNDLGQRTLLAERMINELGASLRRAESLARLKVIALTRPDSSPGQAQAIAVWDPEQQCGLLVFIDPTAIESGIDYQVWLTDPADASPRRGGQVHFDHQGPATFLIKPDQRLRELSTLTLILDRKDAGAPTPGRPVLVGQVPRS